MHGKILVLITRELGLLLLLANAVEQESGRHVQRWRRCSSGIVIALEEVADDRGGDLVGLQDGHLVRSTGDDPQDTRRQQLREPEPDSDRADRIMIAPQQQRPTPFSWTV